MELRRDRCCGIVRRPWSTAPCMSAAPDRTLYALDTVDGAEQWSFPGARYDASVAVVDGVVYAGSNEGVLYALDAAHRHRTVELSPR